MFSRRQFLTRTLKGSSLVALSAWSRSSWPRTAQAAAPGKDNDPGRAGDDRRQRRPQHRHPLRRRPVPQGPAHAAADEGRGHPPRRPRRPELRRCRASGRCGTQGQLAVVQGVGYPNPDRSHFESMDIWQSADPKGQITTGWLGRAVGRVREPLGRRADPAPRPEPAAAGPGRGAGGRGGHASTTRTRSASSSAAARSPSRRPAAGCSRTWRRRPGTRRTDDLASFVQRRQVQTLTAVETLRELLEGPNAVPRQGGGLSQKLQLVAGLIARGFGTRIFYVSLDGFDTHANQGPRTPTCWPTWPTRSPASSRR